MSTCQQCGIGNLPTRANCTTCGADISKAVSGEEAELSALWRIRFDLVEKAGGPGRPLFKQLRFGERFRLGFNLWAWLFGPFYYVAKGMWRKAVSVTCLSLAVTVFMSALAPDGGLEFLNVALNTVLGVWLVLNANINYYKKVVLGDNGWW